MKAAFIWLLPLMIPCVSPFSSAGEMGLPSPVVPSGLGVATHFTDPEPGEMQRLAGAGYRMIRTDLGWGGVERQAGHYDFAAFDRLLTHLKKAGVRPMFILDYGNRLYDHGQSPRTDTARAAFARYAAAAASHFRGQGVVWEIWNEPNIEQFWKPHPDAAAYARLAIETARAVRAADPGAVILAPGSSELPWKYFETIFAAGLVEHIDGVSVHPYRERQPETVVDDYGRLRALIARYASPNRRMLPIISSEWGYSTADGAVSESRQADYLVRQWLTNLSAGVNTSIFYDWRDDGDNPKDRECRFGTVRRNLEPKPSFLAAQKLIQTLQGYTFRHRLQGDSPVEWKLLFQKGDDADSLIVVEWSVDPRSAPGRQTPQYRRVGASDPEAAGLLGLANIRMTPGPLVESEEHPAKLQFEVVNTQHKPALVHAVVRTPELAAYRSFDVAVPPGERSSRPAALATPKLRVEHRQVRLEFLWNDLVLPPIAPLDVWRADPLEISAAPRGQNLQLTIKNPAGTAFVGDLIVRDGGETASGPKVRITEGQDRAVFQLPLPAGPNQLFLVDSTGRTAAQTRKTTYQPLAGFPVGPQSPTDLDAILFVDNAPGSPRPLKMLASDTGAPAPFVLEVPYQFDPGWRYLAVVPRGTLAIPGSASSVVLWVRGNDSGDSLRCRFLDATGQTFQPDLGRLDWTGWRPVRIEFGPGSSFAAAHWGGADDGTPHLPLSWEALLLVDSGHRDQATSRSILVASPYYVQDR